MKKVIFLFKLYLHS